MNRSDTAVEVALSLELPADEVHEAEIDLIEAHLGPLLRQFLFDVPDSLRE